MDMFQWVFDHYPEGATRYYAATQSHLPLPFNWTASYGGLCPRCIATRLNLPFHLVGICWTLLCGKERRELCSCTDYLGPHQITAKYRYPLLLVESLKLFDHHGSGPFYDCCYLFLVHGYPLGANDISQKWDGVHMEFVMLQPWNMMPQPWNSSILPKYSWILTYAVLIILFRSERVMSGLVPPPVTLSIVSCCMDCLAPPVFQGLINDVLKDMLENLWLPTLMAFWSIPYHWKYILNTSSKSCSIY